MSTAVRRVRRSVVVAAAVAVGMLAGCDSERRAISRDDLPEVPDEPTVVVELGPDGFEPATLDVTTDDLVAFDVVGDDDRGVRTTDDEINTGLLLPGERTYVVFDRADTYDVRDISDEDAALIVTATEPGVP